MSSQEIFNQLVPIITMYLPDDVSPEDIQLESDLTAELNINSAHLVDIVLDVEDTFSIVFANEDMETLHTVQDAITIIQKKTTTN